MKFNTKINKSIEFSLRLDWIAVVLFGIGLVAHSVLPSWFLTLEAVIGWIMVGFLGLALVAMVFLIADRRCKPTVEPINWRKLGLNVAIAAFLIISAWVQHLHYLPAALFFMYGSIIWGRVFLIDLLEAH